MSIGFNPFYQKKEKDFNPNSTSIFNCNSSNNPLLSFAISSLSLSLPNSMSISGLSNILSNPNPTKLNSPANPKKINANSKFDPRVCSRSNLSDTKKTSLSPIVMGYGQFSATVIQTSPEKRKEDEERQNYHVNIGYAIRSLREEFPQLFNKELSFDIYRDDIAFKDPMNTFEGIENYKSVFWALRFHGTMFFQSLWIEIISLRQPTEGVIVVRWTIHGVPRVLWEIPVRFDGTSEYKLDKDGKIYEHKIDNIAANSPPKLQASAIEQLILALGYASTPKPTCFENTPSSMSRFAPLADSKHLPYPENFQR